MNSKNIQDSKDQPKVKGDLIATHITSGLRFQSFSIHHHL